MPAGRVIDGGDIWPLLSGRAGATSPHEAFYYYHMEQLQAVRSGRWKLYLPLDAKRVTLGGRTQRAAAELYDLEADVGERTNLADRHPETIRRLTALAERARDDLGDVGRPGKGQRPAAFVKQPKPQVAAKEP